MIEKSGTGGTTVFMQDESGHLLGEYNGSGSLIEETIWLGDIPVATLQPNGSGGVNIYYVHTDHLNSPRKVAQPTTGTLAWRWDTDPFGTESPNQNPAGLGTFPYNLRFPGQYYDSETGLNQNWNRDYDPIVGRYIESDPIGLKGGSWSTYVYVGGNPLSRADPFGLIPRSTRFALCMTAWTAAVTSACLNGAVAVGTCAVCMLLPPPFDAQCAAYCVSNPVTFCAAGTTVVGIAVCTVHCELSPKE